MARKKKEGKPPREFTRRQLSLRQRHKRRQRIIFGVGTIAIVAVVLIVFFGWFNSEYRPLRQTVIRVGDTEFDVNYVADFFVYAGMGGGTADDIYNMLGSVAQNELIRQAAAKLGVTASDEECTQLLKDAAITINDATIDLARRQVLQSKLVDDYFMKYVPESGPQVHMNVMLLESQSQVTEVRDRLVAGSDNFSALSDNFSLDYYSSSVGGDLGWHPQRLFDLYLSSAVPGEYAFGAEAEVGTLSQAVYDESVAKWRGYWLIRVVQRDIEAGVAEVQAILLGSAEEARDILSRLEEGEDLAALAEEYSQNDTSQANGGEMGAVNEGDISTAFSDYVFNPDLELETWSEPVRDDTQKTTGGYWLIEILEKQDDMAISADDRDYLSYLDFNNWATALKDDPAYVVDESYITYDVLELIIEQVMKAEGV